MGANTAEQHNMTRRAAKARRKKSGGKRSEASFSLADAVKKQQQHAEWMRMREESGRRMLDEAIRTGFFELRRPIWGDFDDREDFMKAVRKFEHQVVDLKRAAKASDKRFKWEEQQEGFRIALVR